MIRYADDGEADPIQMYRHYVIKSEKQVESHRSGGGFSYL